MSANALPVVEQAAEVSYQIENPANLEAAVALWKQILPIMGEGIGDYNYKLGLRLDPDWESIAVALANRAMIIVTAKRGEELLGYEIWVLQPYIWQNGVVNALALAAKGGRKRGVDARRLGMIALNYFKSIGVKAVIVSAKRDSRAEKLWQDLGLEELEVLMGKEL